MSASVVKLAPTLFRIPRFNEENCQLPVVAKLPRGISCPVFLEGDGNFIETVKTVNGSRGWRQFLVVVMPFENKRVSICPPDWRHEFMARNCAFDFRVTLLTRRLIE